MFLPEVGQAAMDKYLSRAAECGEQNYMLEIIREMKKENPALYTIVSTSVLIQQYPAFGTILLSHYCMMYKLLRIQAEDDLMSRLFKDDRSE